MADPEQISDYDDAPPEPRPEPRRRRSRRIRLWTRLGLVAAALGLTAVFVIGTQTRPYETDPWTGEYVRDENGDKVALRMGSHKTLGMPECRFKEMFETPCPSCGMTTSFSLLVRGDVGNSLRANWVGTGLATACALAVPWCVASALRGRYLFVRSVEGPLGVGVAVLTVFLLIRWGLIMFGTFFDGGRG